MEIKLIQSINVHDNPSVIITGVTGQDGSHMVDYLLKNTDYTIYGAARRLSVSNHQNIKHVTDPRFVLFNMDVTDPHSVGKSIQTIKPSYFINFAAQSFVGSSWDFPEQTWQTNCTSILHMLEAIRQYKPDCRFYNAGSSEEFGDVAYSPQDEKHPPRPRSPYGASKVAARQLVKVYRESYNLYAVQGWLYNHEGTRRGEEFVTRKISKGAARILKEIKNGEEVVPIVLGNLEAKRDWGDSEDFVDAVWRMMNQDIYNWRWLPTNPAVIEACKDLKNVVPHIKDYVVGTGEEHSIREFVEKAFKIIGIDGFWKGNGVNEVYQWDNAYTVPLAAGGPKDVILVKVDSKFYRPAEVNKLVANYSEIEKDLRWEPTTTFEGLVKKMVDNDTKA